MSESLGTHEEPRKQNGHDDSAARLRMLALEGLTQNHNDINETSLWLHDQINGESDLRTYLYWLGIEAFLRHTRINIRQILTRSSGSEADADEANERFMEGQRRGAENFRQAMRGRILYDMPLPVSGKLLGDATVEDLNEVIAYRDANAKRENRESQITRQVRDALVKSGKRTVREGISLKRLQAIMHP